MSRLLLAVIAVALAALSAAPGAQPVLTYHGALDRGGNFIVPGLTYERARTLHLDESFRPRFTGHVYAQPLFWNAGGSGRGMLLVATEDDTVEALDAATGQAIWRRTLGRPVPRSALPCGNINPLGITGTPVIDAGRAALYLDAAVESPRGPRHQAFALSLKDGSILPGWPVDIADALAGKFLPVNQNQRAALAIFDGNLYIPFSGHWGDCAEYRGMVVGLSLADPHQVRSFATRGLGGGIWAQGGVVSDGRSLFVATGNTLDVATWSDGEAVLRLAPGLRAPADRRDFFAPPDWRTLDAEDADLGGTAPLPIDLAGPGGTQGLIFAVGKNGNAYLLDRDNLGGIAPALTTKRIARNIEIAGPAAYPARDGVFVALQGSGEQCLASGLIVLKARAGSPPTLDNAWCETVRGNGSPIVTTTDGHSSPIVWVLGAEGDDRLHGFAGDSGTPLFKGPAEPLAGLRHFQTLIATADRLYAAADGTVYAFAF